MNARKLPDGGVLYDESDEQEDDIEVDGGDVAASPVLSAAVDWNEGWKNETGLKGAELIGEFVKRLPNAPGVYRMFNEAGDVLYVGKARSLKKRVSNYAVGRGHSNRIAKMVRETANMEFVTTRTEIEALLLEANLIKRLRPRFNVLLRDDKSFPYNR
jgi:excinuclease ABC subunit C